MILQLTHAAKCPKGTQKYNIIVLFQWYPTFSPLPAAKIGQKIEIGGVTQRFASQPLSPETA